jgi:hypothetical protein
VDVSSKAGMSSALKIISMLMASLFLKRGFWLQSINRPCLLNFWCAAHWIPYLNLARPKFFIFRCLFCIFSGSELLYYSVTNRFDQICSNLVKKMANFVKKSHCTREFGQFSAVLKPH